VRYWTFYLEQYWQAMNIPAPMPRLTEEQGGQTVSSYISDLDNMIRTELAEMASNVRIPPEDRTRPMTLKEAAQLMGYEGGKQGASRLSQAIDSGAVKAESRTRQQYVFTKQDFPKEVWQRL
jgi:hypothetical protein